MNWINKIRTKEIFIITLVVDLVIEKFIKRKIKIKEFLFDSILFIFKSFKYFSDFCFFFFKWMSDKN